MSLREMVAREVRMHGCSLGLWTEEEYAARKAEPLTEGLLATADRILEVVRSNTPDRSGEAGETAKQGSTEGEAGCPKGRPPNAA